MILSLQLFGFRAKHGGTCNPGVGLSGHVIRNVKVTCIAYFYCSYGLLQLS